MGEVMLYDYQDCAYHPANCIATECERRIYGHCPENCLAYTTISSRRSHVEVCNSEGTALESAKKYLEKGLKTDRATILDKAKQCVCRDREEDYGSPAENFQTIANLWIDYLQGTGQPVDITPKDVAVMMSLVKIARITSGKHKEDNFIDCCGYIALAGEIEAQERE